MRLVNTTTDHYLISASVHNILSLIRVTPLVIFVGSYKVRFNNDQIQYLLDLIKDHIQNQCLLMDLNNTN